MFWDTDHFTVLTQNVCFRDEDLLMELHELHFTHSEGLNEVSTYTGQAS